MSGYIYGEGGQVGIGASLASAAALGGQKDAHDKIAREAALRVAHNAQEKPEEVVARAQAYLAFIAG